jgi:predicted amidohydrolase YtcJ
MARYTRAEFLSLAALLSGASALPRAATGSHDSHAPDSAGPAPQSGGTGIEPDLVVVNANVLTIDPARPRAEAIAVKDGRFLAVGTSAGIRALASSRTRVIDAARQTVVPGFIDTHCHPSGVSELFGVVVTKLITKASLIDALRKKAAATPAGFWVEGQLFDDTKLTDPTPLDRRDLDRVSTEHPVVVNHRGGHTSWYNSKAFELANVTRDTPDPPDGRFFRDPSGDLTGRVAEQARGAMGRAGRRESFTPEQQRDRGRQGMRYISEQLTAAGLTTVHDAGASADRIRAYEDARAAGELRHRAYLMVRGPFQQLRQAGISTGFGDEWIRIGGVKYGADGSASERTMRMSTPYVDTTDYGILTMTQQEIHERVEEAHRANWQVGIHANGDVTIDMVLNAYERVLKQWPHPDRRHRIEHCSLVNPSLLGRIKATGTIPTPFWTYVYYHGEKWGAYGDDRMRWMFAHRSFLDQGIAVPGASDYGPGPFEPLMAIQSMVTRRDYRGREWGPNQRVTLDDALRIGTINGARASYEENVKGSITPGKYADFVMLAKDPHDVDPNTIKDIAVVRTVVGGKVMHPKGE